MLSDSSSDDLHSSLSSIINGVESPVGSTSSTAPSSFDDDITPFPSPVLSARHLAGLSLGENGDLVSEVDEDKVITEQDITDAVEMKAKANQAFAAKEFNKSIELYTEAIALNPKDSTFWNNRAMSKAKMEEHGGAISDASKAIELNPQYSKAYYRRGTSYLSILRPTDAVTDFKKALSIDPSNRAARDQLNMTVKLIRRIEFEKAISIGETESTSSRCLSLIAQGACALDTSSLSDMPLPQIPSDPNARYTPTPEFVEGMIDTFKKGGKVPKRIAWEIILGVKDLLDKEKSLVEVEVPEGVTCDIVGDTHGVRIEGHLLRDIIDVQVPSAILRCDWVDRGSWGVEVVLTIFAYKWLYPHRVMLNRGNHETSDMNKVYGFEGECKAKHGEMTYKLFADVFTAVPLATLLTASLPPSNPRSEGSKAAILSSEGKKRYFIVHGGPPVSKDGVTLDEVKAIDRYGKQPGQEGLMCELLWTDPQEQIGRGPSKRGVGLGFGPDVTRRWCELNKVTAVIRSHEVRADGYAIEHDGLCITTFSCPNYCDVTGNKAAFVKMQPDGQLSYHQFDAVPHPAVKPMAYSSGFNFM
ncbi:serine/threonine-protein phosphatase 5, partial [Tremellales sp. Uapishka_1]